jgi:hypothetical protein
MTEHKKRGRPALPVDVKITRELTHRLTRVNAVLEAVLENRDWRGKPRDHYSRALLDGWIGAHRLGMSKWGFVRDFFLRIDVDLDDEEVREVVQQLNRLLPSK